MVVRLVANGDSFLHQFSPPLAVDAEARAVGHLLRVVADDAAQMIEQTGDAGSDGG